MDNEKLAGRLRLWLGLAMLLLGWLPFVLAVKSGNQGLAIMGIFATATCAILAGLCLYPLLAEPFANWFVDCFYSSRSGGKIQKQYSRIRALVAQHEYEAAASGLRDELARDPEPLDGWLLLAGILHDHLQQSREAFDLLSRQLAASPHWREGHERLVLLGVDILLTMDAREDAIRLLRENIRRAGKSPAAAKLQARLNHL